MENQSGNIKRSNPRLLSRRGFIQTFGACALGGAAMGAGGLGYFLSRINQVGDFATTRVNELYNGQSNILFEQYPGLLGKLPWHPVGTFPTPVEELHPPVQMDGGRLFVKRDDVSSPLYGGNKVRKLEHFLAEASLHRAKALITLGGIGSNHALATALHGNANGFEVDVSLFDQPVTQFVKANLSGMVQAGARIRYSQGKAQCLWSARRLYAERKGEGYHPYFISAGGTTRLGNIGYVTAGLELAQQIKDGLLPEPDRIFVAAGTCGSVAGLIAGLKLAGLRSRVVAVRVTDPVFCNHLIIRKYASDVAGYLHELDANIPGVAISGDEFELTGDYLGAGYGVPTRQATAAVERSSPSLHLETTYTGKALAACLDYCRTKGKHQTVLFWNTYNSRPFPKAASTEGLPESLRSIFDETE